MGQMFGSSTTGSWFLQANLKINKKIYAVPFSTRQWNNNEVNGQMLVPKALRCEYLENPLGMDVLNPRLNWRVENAGKDSTSSFQAAYQILVASSREKLDKLEGDLWDTGKVASDQSIHVEYQGKLLKARAWCYWKVKVWDEEGRASNWDDCPVAFWHVGLLHNTDWGRAQWIGAPAREPKRMKVKDKTKDYMQEIIASDPSPLLRKKFAVSGDILRAMLYVTALGEYEVRLNGKRVGDQYLAPEWTDYTKRVQYQTYDVTGQVQPGQNAIGVLLGDGWYLGLLGPGDAIRQRYYGQTRRLLLKLVIETRDGKSTEIVSDGTWKLHENGPINYADHFMGEAYTCALEYDGWDMPEFDDNNRVHWVNVVEDDGVNVNLVAQKNEPVRIFETLNPIALTSSRKDTYIFDFGQNLVGWCEILIDGKAGQDFILRHGEMLEENGTLYIDNLRLAAQTDTFLHDGRGPRWIQPHFTFHGFRYVEVTGFTVKPDLGVMKAHAIRSCAPETGAFECSNVMLNQLWKNILWTQRNNMASIPTDCPQRNERMGWMGDAQVFAQTAIYNMNMAAFFSKFTVDMRDAQGEEGQYTDFAPHPYPAKTAMSFGPGWADCGIIIPWRLYVAYGDTRVLAEHYESMKKYVDLIYDENPDYIWKVWGSNYGDWLNGDTIKNAKGYPIKGGELPKVPYATLFYWLSSSLLAKIAGVFGLREDQEKYLHLAKNVQDAFIKNFVKSDGKIEGNTQAGYALALGFGILPPALHEKAVKHLLDALKAYGNRISTGFISTIQMMLELSARGHNDLAYKLVESHQFPSWGYSIDQGATTIWERWDGYVKGRGFQDRGMNSFDHYSIGAVGEWMYRVILGINFDEAQPGMKHVILTPKPDGTLTWARGHYDSIRGRIAVGWEIKGDQTTYHFEIPPNVLATITLEKQEGAQVLERGKPAKENPRVQVLEEADTLIKMAVKAGTHDFAIQKG